MLNGVDNVESCFIDSIIVEWWQNICYLFTAFFALRLITSIDGIEVNILDNSNKRTSESESDSNPVFNFFHQKKKTFTACCHYILPSFIWINNIFISTPYIKFFNNPLPTTITLQTSFELEFLFWHFYCFFFFKFKNIFF